MFAHAWGNNQHGQLGLGHTSTAILRPTPAGAVNSWTAGSPGRPGVATFQAQYNSALLLCTDGTSLGVGGKADGQLVDGRGGYTDEASVLTPEPTLYRRAKQLACRSAHSLALLLDGTCEAGGGNAFATRGDGTKEALRDIAGDLFPSAVKLPTEASGHVAAVIAGDVACSALLDNGRLLSWGTNGIGQVGDGTRITRLAPVYTLSNVRAAARGWSHGLALLTNGQVMAWGNNNHGQCGPGAHETFITTPVLVTLPEPVVAVAAAGAISLAITQNGTLYEWGLLAKYETRTVTGSTPRKAFSRVTAVDAGCYQTNSTVLAVADGQVYGWGQNDFGQVGDGTRVTRLSPVGTGLAATSVSCGTVDSRAW